MGHIAGDFPKGKFIRLILAVIVAGAGVAHSGNVVLQGSTAFATGIAQPHAGAVEALTVAQEPGAIGVAQPAIVRSSCAVELVADEPIAQILSLVSLDGPSPVVRAAIEAFRRIAGQGN